MPRRTISERRRAALKGWRTRRRNEAAKKRKRARKKIPAKLVNLGYVSHENSFTIVVLIRPRKRLSDDNLIKLVTRLISEGFFDDSPENPVADLVWTVPLINYAETLPAPYAKIKKGHAGLVSFNRTSPDSLP